LTCCIETENDVAGIGERVTLAEKKKRALEARLEGASLGEIAKELGQSISCVSKWLKGELDRVNEERTDLVRHMQFVQAARLDALLKAMWPLVQNGDVSAIAQVVKIEERRAKLFGLDEPQRIQATFDLQGQSDAALQAIAIRLGLTVALPEVPLGELPLALPPMSVETVAEEADEDGISPTTPGDDDAG
jgi:transposase